MASLYIVISAGTVKVGAVLSSDRDDLVCGRGVAAVIGQGPGPGDDLFAFAGTGYYYISKGGIKRGVAVVCLVSYISCDATLAS